MTSTFSLVKNALMASEGGYVNDPSDAGGETNFGISKRQYPLVDIRNLTFDAAAAIYEHDYWNPYLFSEIGNQIVANQLFLASVNIGPKHAFECIQTALNSVVCYVGVDGILGPNTISAINQANSGWLLDAMRVQLCAYYSSIVTNKPDQIRFLHGWIRRALR